MGGKQSSTRACDAGGGPGVGPLGPPLAGGSGEVLLREAEQLSAYIEGGGSSGEKQQLNFSWGEKAHVLPALRRLLLSPCKERDTIKYAIDSILPPSYTPISEEDPHILAGKLWLQARLFAMHEKAPLQL